MQNVSSGIASADPIAKTIPLDLDPPLHLLAVNRRPFRGLSVYLTQLWNHHPTIGTDPTFQILVRYGDSRPFAAQFLIPHCTCSTDSTWQLVQLFLLPPLFCVLLAFFIVLRRPGELRVWGIAALLLAMSQLDLFPHGAGFQLTANTVAWPDRFRIPGTGYRAFTQYVWPAALVVTVSHLFSARPAVRRCSLWAAALLLGWCLLQSLLAVAWAEYYLLFASLYDFLQQHRSELIAATFILIAVLSFIHNRALGVVVFAFALAASSVPYWPLSMTNAERVVLWRTAPLSGLQYRQYIPTLPMPVVSSRAVVPAFAVATLLFVLTFEFRRTKRLLSISMLSLVFPALYVIGVLNGNVYLGMSWSYLRFALFCAGGGLLGICTYCLSNRTE